MNDTTCDSIQSATSQSRLMSSHPVHDDMPSTHDQTHSSYGPPYSAHHSPHTHGAAPLDDVCEFVGVPPVPPHGQHTSHTTTHVQPHVAYADGPMEHAAPADHVPHVEYNQPSEMHYSQQDVTHSQPQAHNWMHLHDKQTHETAESLLLIAHSRTERHTHTHLHGDRAHSHEHSHKHLELSHHEYQPEHVPHADLPHHVHPPDGDDERVHRMDVDDVVGHQYADRNYPDQPLTYKAAEGVIRTVKSGTMSSSTPEPGAHYGKPMVMDFHDYSATTGKV